MKVPTVTGSKWSSILSLNLKARKLPKTTAVRYCKDFQKKEDHKNLEEIVVSQMEEGFKKEQHARQQVQNEIAQGFKNEENARQLVQKEPAIMKDEIKNLEMGSGSTVCSEAGVRYSCSATSTFFSVERNFHSKENGIQRLGHRLFKEWPSGSGGWRDNDILDFTWRKRCRNRPKDGLIWTKTRKEQGRRPRKIVGSMWFQQEMSLTAMIDLLKMMKEEWDKAAYDINGQRVKARLEVSPQRRPLEKAQAMFSKDSRL